MRRTEILQEIRIMRFEEAYSVWTEKRLSQEEAARILGVCDRTFRRYIDRYEEDGLDGLMDKRLTQASSRRVPVDEAIALARQYEGRYRGWNVKHFHSWYRRDGGQRRSAARHFFRKAAPVYDFRNFPEQYKADNSFATKPDSSICCQHS